MERPNLNKIIAQNKDKTGHIPNKGLSRLPGKKTVPYISMDGFKNGLPPNGTHYRIPSDTLYNPTPYRIKAKANTGQEEWLEPYTNQSVNFPGADYVDEYFKGGGGTGKGGGFWDWLRNLFGGKGGRGSFDCPGDVCSPGKMKFEKPSRVKKNRGSGGGGSSFINPFDGNDDEICYDEEGNEVPCYQGSSVIYYGGGGGGGNNGGGGGCDPSTGVCKPPAPEEGKVSPVYEDAIVGDFPKNYKQAVNEYNQLYPDYDYYQNKIKEEGPAYNELHPPGPGASSPEASIKSNTAKYGGWLDKYNIGGEKPTTEKPATENPSSTNTSKEEVSSGLPSDYRARWNNLHSYIRDQVGYDEANPIAVQPKVRGFNETKTFVDQYNKLNPNATFSTDWIPHVENELTGTIIPNKTKFAERRGMQQKQPLVGGRRDIIGYRMLGNTYKYPDMTLVSSQGSKDLGIPGANYQMDAGSAYSSNGSSSGRNIANEGMPQHVYVGGKQVKLTIIPGEGAWIRNPETGDVSKYDPQRYNPKSGRYLKHGGWLNNYFNEGGSYVVKKGDTLSKISRETGVSMNDLIKANKIKDANVIGVNQKLILPVAGQPAVEQQWQNWSDINKYNQYLNSLQDEGDYTGDERRIAAYYKNQPEEVYTVVDKKRGRLNVYKGDKLINTYPVGTGASAGDAQTVTRIVNGKVDWDAGNKMTGAGVYTVAGSQKKDPHYSDAASWNFANDKGENVAMALHSSFGDRTAKIKDKDIANNRLSNGCINGICYNLDELYNTGYTVGNKMYVLPEDRGNSFQIVDGKPVLRVNTNINNYNQYKDAKGRVQKGQGVNRSVNTLVYKPIQGIFDRGKFEKNVYTPWDYNDQKEYENTTKPYYTSLVNNKKAIMQAAGIPSDVYNEIARMAFGIYGTESNFGDEHLAPNNLIKAIGKIDYGKTIGNLFSGKFKVETDDAVGGPDVKSKAETYRADDKNQSVGYTQLRWAQLNNDEKKALAKVGITKNTDFLDPSKAAMGTAVVLGVRYNQQLTSEQKKDMWKHLPTKWNKRSNYASRVKNNAQYLTFRQYDDKRKMGGEPCYQCGGMYDNGGSTGWLNEYL